MQRYPDDFSKFIARHFAGKIQKLTLNTAMSCPNRDGSKGTGGCIYCNNSSFSPGFTANPPSVTEQLARSKEFFARKYPQMRYLAYFQSYTSTYGDTRHLMSLYREALECDGIEGIIIGTRPDCMPDELLNELAELRKRTFVMVEYGAESSHNLTLELINRCHTWEETCDAVQRTHAAGIPTGLHLIMGLPGEGREEMLATIDRVNTLPVDIIKCHQLQLIRGTQLANEVAAGRMSVTNYSVEEYADLCCDIIERLREGIAVERFVSQSPAEMLISPKWGLKNYQFTELLRKRFSERLSR